MSNETKAIILCNPYSEFRGTLRTLPVAAYPNAYLCIPADEAREFLTEAEEALLVLAAHATRDDDEPMGEKEFAARTDYIHKVMMGGTITKARALLALIPKEETDGAEV